MPDHYDEQGNIPGPGKPEYDWVHEKENKIFKDLRNFAAEGLVKTILKIPPSTPSVTSNIPPDYEGIINQSEIYGTSRFKQPQISDLTTGGLGPLMTPYNSSADVKLTQWGSYDPGYGEELLKKHPLPDWSKYRYYDGPPNKNLFKGLGAEENKAAQDSLYNKFEKLNTYIGSKGLRITDKNALHNLPYGVSNVWYAPDNTPYKIKADRSLKTFKLQNMTARLRRKAGDIQSSIIQRRQRNRLDRQKRLTNRDRVKMEQTLTQKANDLRDNLVKKLQAVRSYTSSSPGAAYVTGAGTSSDVPRIENQITTLITEFEEGRLFGEHGHAISSPVWNILRLKSNPNYRKFFPGDARNYHLVEDSNSLSFSKSKSMLERLIYSDPKYQDLVVNYNPYLEKDGQQGIIRIELMNTVDYRDPNDYSKPGKILYGKTFLTFDVNSIPRDELPQTKDEWEGLLETQLGGREPAPRPEFGEPVYKDTEPQTTEEIIEDVFEKRIDKDKDE